MRIVKILLVYSIIVFCALITSESVFGWSGTKFVDAMKAEPDLISYNGGSSTIKALVWDAEIDWYVPGELVHFYCSKKVGTYEWEREYVWFASAVTEVHGTYSKYGPFYATVTFSDPSSYGIHEQFIKAVHSSSYGSGVSTIVYCWEITIGTPDWPIYIRVNQNSDSVGASTNSDRRVTGTFVWSQISGPGNMTFSPSQQVGSGSNPVVYTDTVGTYRVRVDFSGEEGSGSDESGDIVVYELQMTTPSIFPVAVELNETISFDTTITPAGIPGTYTWGKVSGPGNVTFSSPNSANTNFSADTTGVYRVQVEFSTADSSHTVKSGEIWVVNCELAEMTAYRPQSQYFQRTEVPDGEEENPGVGIRINGDNNSNNLIEVRLDVDPYSLPQGANYILERSNSKIKIWEDQNKIIPILDSNDEAIVTFTDSSKTIWLEFIDGNGGNSLLELKAKTAAGQEVDGDKLSFFSFSSVVIAIGGENQVPSDPPDSNHGTFVIAKQLYEAGYDVHMFDEDELESGIREEAIIAIRDRKVSEVAIIGYSHGGGATHDLAEYLDNNRGSIGIFTISYAAYTDAIAEPWWFAEDRRPPGSNYLTNQYQLRDFLQGGPINFPGADYELNVNTTAWGANLGHGDIDDHQNVCDEVLNQLKQEVVPW